MTKTIRQMQEDIKLVDLVIEIIDARVPVSSRNPDIDALASGKARLLILNKADLADEKENARWLRYFKDQGLVAVLTDARNRGSVKNLMPSITEACREKIERDRARGMKERPIRTPRYEGTPDPYHGGGNPERGKVDVHQFIFREGDG